METTSSAESPIDMLSPHGKLLVDAHAPCGSESEAEGDDDEGNSGGAPDSAPREELADDNEAARVEVEDAIAEDCEAEERAKGGGGASFGRTIDVGGKPVMKSRALAAYGRYRTYATSFDRLKRVRHAERYTPKEDLSSSMQCEVDEESESTKSVFVQDPIATILWSDDRPWLCVGEIIGIKVDGRPVDEIPHEFLGEESVRIAYQMMGGIPETSFTVPGGLVESIDPDVGFLPSQPSKIFYLLDSAFLVALSAGLLARLSLADLKQAPKAAPTPFFPAVQESHVSSARTTAHSQDSVARIQSSASIASPRRRLIFPKVSAFSSIWLPTCYTTQRSRQRTNLADYAFVRLPYVYSILEKGRGPMLA